MPFGNLGRLQQPYLPCAPLLTPSKNTSGFARCRFSLPSRAGSSLVHHHEKGDKGSCWVPVPPDGRGSGSVGVFQVIWKHPRAVLATGAMTAATQPPCWREPARPCPGEEPFLGMGPQCKGGTAALCFSKARPTVLHPSHLNLLQKERDLPDFLRTCVCPSISHTHPFSIPTLHLSFVSQGTGSLLVVPNVLGFVS